MCGFVGLINKDGTVVEATLLKAMADTLAHRGPDDEGSLIEGPVGLYHKRLSIIDLATGHQPMTSDGVTVVFNGEIYNYIELRDDLKRKGHRFATTSDTEVLLRMYLEHGPSFVNQLNGMFAFVLFDARKRSLVVARDHFGIKPVYVFESERHLIFASEIKALLEHPAVPREPNPDALHDYIALQYVLGDATLFKGVLKLRPGEYRVFDLKSFQRQIVRYWEPVFKVDAYHTEAYFRDQLRWLLEDAIRLQVRADVPVGSYLSGGLDSSLVAVLASDQLGTSIRTFTGAFREGKDFDESGYAKLVAESIKAQDFLIYPSDQDFIDVMPKIAYYMDEPMAGPGVFPQYMVSRLASREVKVCLGGQGGDEIFGGYARYVVAYLEQAVKGAISETTEEGEHIVSLRSILPNLPALQQYQPMLARFWEAGLFAPMDQRYFRLIDRSEGKLDTLSDDFRATHRVEEIFARFQQVFNHPDTLSYYNKMSHFDMIVSLPALLHVEDRMSMASSLESRVPILDRRIADLIASMPPSMKFKGGEMKYILKRSIGDRIPEPVLHRKDKMGFPVPLHIWARGRARDFFKDVLLSKACRERGLFDMPHVEALLDHEGAYGRKLWGLLNIELWFRTFIDAA
ncbi:MAG: asparagine synthase (glutamine-hydrolyzing) [Acidobacteria bacterium]|nr:asparagine synthase (glutamine-hydrolyzing) [Acidobacteriota bacterium]